MEFDMQTKIEQATYQDLPQILALQKSCYRQEAALYNDFEIPPLVQTIESIKADFERWVFLKIESNSHLIGSVRGLVAQGTCKIGRLIVHQDFQNQGLGKRLMQAIENIDESVQRFELFTGHKSVKNLALYHKLGYVEFERKQVNPRLTLVFLEKII